MGNIIDYVRKTAQGFDELPLNRVDSLVFSWLAYCRMPSSATAVRAKAGMALAELCVASNMLEMSAEMHKASTTQELLAAVAASPRFAPVVACLHTERSSKVGEEQFSATTFCLPGRGAYVAFRGTDNTLIGWKEDFNMAYAESVPAQTSAKAYLKLVACELEGPLWVGGHSKGGNLAVYALCTAAEEVRTRVVKCFSHDGPGFNELTRASAGWVDAWEQVDKTVPDESLVGLLMEPHAQECTIVKSTDPGIMQHSPFTWVVEGNDFATKSAITYETYRRNKRFASWLGDMDAASRERFVEILFKLAQATGEVTFSGLIDSFSKGSLSLIDQRLDALDADDRGFFIDAVDELAATMLLGPASDYDRSPKTALETSEAAASKMDDITAKFNDRMSELERRLGL